VNGMKDGRVRQTPAGPIYVGRTGVSLGLGISKHTRVLMQFSRYLRVSPTL
jgi:hypothetical protein